MRWPWQSAEATLNHRRFGSGEPIILIHGIGGELCVWEPVLEPLARELEVIPLDLPGFGGSRALPDEVEPTPLRLAQSVVELMDELGIERAHFAGNSLGGWVAMELGKTDRALSVTALCPAGLWGAPIRREGPPVKGRAHAVAQTLRPAIPLLMLSPKARRLALGHVVADPDRVPYGPARRMVSSYARAAAYDATNWAMRGSNFTQPELIRVPLTLAFGERDRLIRPVRLQVPGARSLVLRGCGHIPMWDDPELVTKLILETVASAQPAGVAA